MKIGDFQSETPLFLAPMAGYTDRAARLICRKYGADFTESEMVSARALVYQDRKSAPLARLLFDELPGAVQLFGSDPAIIAEAAKIVASGTAGGVPPTAIDLNFGCPVRKIVSNGEGSALMRDPNKIGRIVSAVVKAVDLPVTVKIRAGWDASEKNAAECARAAESAGCSAIFLHARTRSQFYSGAADLSVIREVKRAVSVPVVGNGDVVDAKSALRMLNETGCDGLMVGRAAVGRPFVFREIRAAIDGKPIPEVTPAERLEAALRQLDLAIEDKGEKIAVLESRKQAAQYLFGLRDAAAFRREICEAKTREEVEAILRRALSAQGPIR
ncbi:MAG: tRNA dihydrouridine synthase DusB [Clostridia bacterium]|nr:tRNA dihydrouridine synthase DusB [Clostridia bacterium]